ncbi:hypothetical protein HKD37_19G053304 [Glycine soja]
MYIGGPLGTSTLTFRGLHILTFRGLCVLAFRGPHVLPFRGLHTLAFKGLHALALRGLCILIFSVFHIHTLREFRPPPDIGGRPTVRAQPERKAITQLLYILGQDFTRAAAKRRVWIMHANMTTLTQDIDDGSGLQDTQCTRRSPTGPWGFQLWLRASFSPTGCLSPPASSCHRDIGITPARHPVDSEKSNRVLELPALITGLCRFYGVPVAPSKRPQASAGRNTPVAWGWPTTGNRRTTTTSRVHLSSSTKRLEHCLRHMADQ